MASKQWHWYPNPGDGEFAYVINHCQILPSLTFWEPTGYMEIKGGFSGEKGSEDAPQRIFLWSAGSEVFQKKVQKKDL